MLAEITTTLIGGGVFAFGHFAKNKGGSDHKKIQLIAKNCGLVSKDGKEIRIHRKSGNREWSEYVYQMPHGLSYKQFKEKLHNFQDGLNIKGTILDISLKDFKQLKLQADIFNQIKTIIEKKRTLKKEVDIEFDGMLKFRVYNEPLTDKYTFEDATAKKINGWKAVVGINRMGKRILIDFEKVYHIIVSGTSGYGKSNWINSTINILVGNHPDDVTFTFIDLKDGLELNRYRNLKQVKSYAETPEEAKVALEKAINEMSNMNAYLKQNGFSNVKDAGIKKRHFVIVDEGADLADDDVCQGYLTDIARKGRASGLKLIFATQYPTAQVVRSQIKRQCMGRLSFVLDTAIASNVALDQSGAESLPPIEGRALYKELKLIEVQTPYIDDKTIRDNIEPHIRFQARKESKNAQHHEEGTETGKHSLELEEVGLFEQKPAAKTPPSRKR
ncbi:FtsK/SpoIIIE domain-containing protein [Rossellomorea aquimaris]|uniref:FtsK/SpoIIIE domain-containing protein n=1 Tax=Rossellomorea aquimaris TaxID=189382 RepID=UPI0011E957ED|nr:FtsK/SpoIIIE domain-containing protein [Rossellomorea aquimaris]TYS91883.1 cell division protein FtsK [Rossellomorea aquimaris]